MTVSLLALATFWGLVAFGAALSVVRWRGATEAVQQRSTSLFVLYVLIVSGMAGFSQRDLWPFSSWRLMVGAAPEAIGDAPNPQSLRIRVFEPDGVEHAVDYRAWQPLSVEDLSTWLIRSFPDLAPDAQRRVAADLLGRANEGRERTLAGDSPGSFDRIFGPFSAPYHLLHPRRWRRPTDVPAQPFAGLRLYREYFDLEELRRDGRMRLDLVYEYRGGDF